MSTDQITTVEAAKRLGVSLNWVYMLIRCGELPATKTGKKWLIPVTAIDERRQVTAARLSARFLQDSEITEARD